MRTPVDPKIIKCKWTISKELRQKFHVVKLRSTSIWVNCLLVWFASLCTPLQMRWFSSFSARWKSFKMLISVMIIGQQIRIDVRKSPILHLMATKQCTLFCTHTRTHFQRNLSTCKLPERTAIRFSAWPQYGRCCFCSACVNAMHTCENEKAKQLITTNKFHSNLKSLC